MWGVGRAWRALGAGDTEGADVESVPRVPLTPGDRPFPLVLPLLPACLDRAPESDGGGRPGPTQAGVAPARLDASSSLWKGHRRRPSTVPRRPKRRPSIPRYSPRDLTAAGSGRKRGGPREPPWAPFYWKARDVGASHLGPLRRPLRTTPIGLTSRRVETPGDWFGRCLGARPVDEGRAEGSRTSYSTFLGPFVCSPAPPVRQIEAKRRLILKGVTGWPLKPNDERVFHLP